VEAVSVWPTTALPLIAGNAVFAGGATTGAGATAAVALEVATDDPALFDAVTATRSAEPTSPTAGTYEELTAPARDAQLLPEPSQRSHWYAYELTPPLQLPVLALSFWPTTAEPLTVGRAVDVGGFCPLVWPAPFPAPLTLGNKNTASTANRTRPVLSGPSHLHRGERFTRSSGMEVGDTSVLRSGVPLRLRLGAFIGRGLEFRLPRVRDSRRRASEAR
jgi:hypothetical protein